MPVAKLLSMALGRAAVAATRIFYEIGRQGPELPDGPLLVVANHPNSILDALVIFTVAGRAVAPLARAPLFERPFIGQVLRELGGLPVYRPQDQPQMVQRNEATFDAVVRALQRGAAVLIFPEGTSHSETELVPLRTGAARLALRAEAESDWRLGLRIVPVGLTYRRKTRFRGEVGVFVGEPFAVAPWRAAAERDAVAAVRDLTEAIAAALEQVTLNFSGRDNEPLLDAAEALYAAERGLGAPGDDALAPRLPRLQLFAAGMNWLRAHDPVRLDRLAEAVRTYRARLARLGVRDGELPQRQTWLDLVRLVGVEGFWAVAGLPLGALGAVAWYVPYALRQLVLRVHRPAYEAQATIKLVTSLVAFPIVYGLWLAWAWAWKGPGAAAVAAVLLPAAGFATLHWREHWRDLEQEARFVWRATRRRALAELLRARRGAIADEIDRIADEWDAETRRRLDGGARLP
jgi:1-acyl-sn-glycerol-3-phosphate acyltransferase